MTEGLLRASICVASALLAANLYAHAIGLVSPCERYTSCGDCRASSSASSSASCGWCSTAGSSSRRCVQLSTALGPDTSCSACEERSRTVWEAGGCDDSTCLGVDDKFCSDHGTCSCGTCTCEPGYTGHACQNCPMKQEDCPAGGGGCCENIYDCMKWQSSCATCMRKNRNATQCETCPPDTLFVTSDPGEPQSAECVFDSLSFSSDLHCSYHVYHWRDESAALTRHARIQLVCSSASDKVIFPKWGEPAESDYEDAVPTPAVTAAPTAAAPAPPRAPPEKVSEKAAEEGSTERPEGAAKTASAAAAALCQATVLLCSLWTLLGLR